MHVEKPDVTSSTNTKDAEKVVYNQLLVTSSSVSPRDINPLNYAALSQIITTKMLSQVL